MYENKKILILGAAKSGVAVAKLLARHNNDITLSDMKEINADVVKELELLGINIIITDNQLDLIDKEYDLIIKNPAIMATSPIAKKTKELNIPLVNEVEVAYHFLPKDVKIIGITGSNGKTTVTTMIYELMQKLNMPVVLGGNIGYPLSQILDKVKKNDILVLELSDHQLNDIKDFKTDISVLTNISPAHLDYHGSYEHYKRAKKNIFNRHTENDIAIINKHNRDALEVSIDIKSHKEYFNDEANYYDENGIYIADKKVLDYKDIAIKGNHNYENILATLLVVKNFAWDINIIKNYFKEFKGVEHRLELVAKKNGVLYYNDSKSTNNEATITALKTFNEPIHLILGGLDRGQDFHELDNYMQNVKMIYAIGSTVNRVEEYAKEINKPCIIAKTLEKAMTEISKNVIEGDVVLLSPASSSQDFYVKFEDRGEEFKKLVAKI